MFLWYQNLSLKSFFIYFVLTNLYYHSVTTFILLLAILTMLCFLIPHCFLPYVGLIFWTCSKHICFLIKFGDLTIRLVLHATWIFYQPVQRPLSKILLGHWRSLTIFIKFVANLEIDCFLTYLLALMTIKYAFVLVPKLIE